MQAEGFAFQDIVVKRQQSQVPQQSPLWRQRAAEVVQAKVQLNQGAVPRSPISGQRACKLTTGMNQLRQELLCAVAETEPASLSRGYPSHRL